MCACVLAKLESLRERERESDMRDVIIRSISNSDVFFLAGKQIFFFDVQIFYY